MQKHAARSRAIAYFHFVGVAIFKRLTCHRLSNRNLESVNAAGAAAHARQPAINAFPWRCTHRRVTHTGHIINGGGHRLVSSSRRSCAYEDEVSAGGGALSCTRAAACRGLVPRPSRKSRPPRAWMLDTSSEKS
ncbi:hypothetical protein EVAR_102693_1 [Eumeta japonica]|uniref:Uncharacterized protein n=1 Tax=Eumeta variegata TaxID=151549 RepID=A0A4C1TL12_EUMVA|nr:hypothetical protein EVAR_102693_1 [Eumeta japonica]